MNKVKYYKETNQTVGGYALKKMMNVFGIATPIERIAQYFKYPEWRIQEWERTHDIPDDFAFEIIEKLTGEKPDSYVTEKSQAIDFILNKH
jgi:hypothetical protein